MRPPDVIDGVFGDVHQLVPVGVLEFVGKRISQHAVKTETHRDGTAGRVSHDCASLDAMALFDRSTASAVYVEQFSQTDRRLISVYHPVLRTRKRKYYSRGQEWCVEWRDFGQPLPAWFDPLMQGFADLLTLHRFIPSWGCRSSQGLGCSPIKAVRELG